MILKERSRGWAGAGAEPSAAVGPCWCEAAGSPCTAPAGAPGGGGIWRGCFELQSDLA